MDGAKKVTDEKIRTKDNIVAYETILKERVFEEFGEIDTFTQQFEALTTNHERVTYMYDYMVRYDLLKGRYWKDAKNDEVARRHKKKGDNNFARGDFPSALKHYTRCIMKAESGELRGLAYANRSAALFKLSLYRECLEDIKRAVGNNYPGSLRPSLLYRRERATQMLGRTRTPKYHERTPTLPRGARNRNTPHAHCIKQIHVELDENSRRRVLVNNITPAGKLISVETSMVNVVSGKSDLYHCHQCLNICYNPTPCLTCTQVVYCGQNCALDAWYDYHQYECAILSPLKRWVGYCKSLLVGVKMIFLAKLEQFRNDFDRYLNPIENIVKKDVPKDNMFLALAASVIYYFIRDFTKFFPEESKRDPNFDNQFKDDLFKYLHMAYVFSAEITEAKQVFGVAPLRPFQDVYIEKESFGLGIYPFFMHFRHACCPNVVIHHYGSTMVLRTTRKCLKGEELFVSYG
ncbi:hypothetical protein Zmor_023089 [Zophobas morio]|uniref:SET and MYND domain-containing protein 4 n=1 Tax=Zophobas morio TaxID=2755281 RepID=A0AA38HZ02_9CUCU|nr:hypothetical protein Zmor_023089 [Zophobas morio]